MWIQYACMHNCYFQESMVRESLYRYRYVQYSELSLFRSPWGQSSITGWISEVAALQDSCSLFSNFKASLMYIWYRLGCFVEVAAFQRPRIKRVHCIAEGHTGVCPGLERGGCSCASAKLFPRSHSLFVH